MAEDWQHTCWQGMDIRHPPDWELASVSEGAAGGRCSFFDRLHLRLEVIWNPPRKALSPDDVAASWRKQAGEQGQDISLPWPWQGLLRTAGAQTHTQAVRRFDTPELLAEVSIRWISGRDEQIEREILEGVAPQPAKSSPQHWRALGVDLQIGRQFELVKAQTLVGRIGLVFETPQRRPLTVGIERLSLVQYWLDGPIEDWLVRELPRKPRRRKVIARRERTMNGHPAREIVSHSKIDIFRYLAGYRDARVDVAWECPLESRLYHVWVARTVRDDEPPLPESLQVKCCQPPPQVERRAPR